MSFLMYYIAIKYYQHLKINCMQIIDRINEFNFDEQISKITEDRRLEFIAKFPIDKIKDLTLDDYALGNNNQHSFCNLLASDHLLFNPGGTSNKFGLYRSLESREYVIVRGNQGVEVKENELIIFFEEIKRSISKILELMSENNIDEIQKVETAIYQSVIIKILCIYFPDKFIPIGSLDVLKKCAKDLNINKLYLSPNYHIKLNYEIKKEINTLDQFKDWSYNKIGSYLWRLFRNQDNITKIEDVEIKEQTKSKSNDFSSTEYFKTNETSNKTKSNFINPTLNTILYGPPGTGKTYNTLIHAAKIISENDNLTFEEAQRIFNENLGDRIEFITFHQNFSYEDFIQGIRPDISEESNLKFKKIDGVFKRIVDRALENYNLSLKSSEEVSKILAFKEALEQFKNKINESEKPYKINKTVHILRVEDDAFRYSADSWKELNGFRMKFSDLIEFNENNVATRQEIKKLNNISGLAKQHASYYFKTYEMIKNLITPVEQSTKVSLQNYVIIIDEINRANISRVFGELITLIEEDKRSHGKIPLSAILPSGDKFVVPSNLYIIGTMNTADKSIALLDIALRRRFEFKAFYPDYSLENIHDLDILRTLNATIIEKKSHDFQIGHSFFMDEKYDLISTMNHKVIPLISEYFMNDKNDILEILNSVFGKSNDLRIVDNSWPIKLEKIN